MGLKHDLTHDELVDYLHDEFNGDWLRMAGTEKTYEYVVIAATLFGRVGFRDFTHQGSPLRVRVELIGIGFEKFSSLSREAGWKQPGDGGQHRYSTVVPAGLCDKQAAGALKLALAAIGAGEKTTLVNAAAPEWARELIGIRPTEKVTLVPPTTDQTMWWGSIVLPKIVPAHPKVSEMLTHVAHLFQSRNDKHAAAKGEVEKAKEEGARIVAEAQAKAEQLLKLAEGFASERNAEADTLKEQAEELLAAAQKLNEALQVVISAGVVELYPVAPTPKPTRKQLESLLVVDLRAMLRERGSKIAGIKADLIKRLLG